MNNLKTLIAAALITVSGISHAQDKFGTRDGSISFFSHAPLEDITAVNHKAASVYIPATGAIEFSALVKAFEFEKALMQEHFNENYMESGTFPKALFKGRLVPKDGDDLTKSGSYDVGVEGTLTIHGVGKPLSTSAKVEVAKDGTITAKSEFTVKPEDHDISIPGVVRGKIAESIQVSVDIKYTKL